VKQRCRSDLSSAGEERLLRRLVVLQAELEVQHQALRDAEAELERRRDLYDNAPIAYVDLDACSKILAANSLSQDLLGAQAVSSYLPQYLAPGEADAFERYRLEVIGSPDRFVGEFSVVDANGRLREVRVDGVRTKEDGSEWRAALLDVTAQNAARRRADHAARLEIIGEHASGVAHDLSNLLYGVAVHADLALQFVRDGLSAHQPLEQIRDALRQCTSAIEQLTCCSRAEAEAPSILDLNDALATRQAFMASLLGEDIELELDVAAPDPSTRIVDSHLEQILVRALRNAR
jgi:signal transduction histidine kinase